MDHNVTLKVCYNYSKQNKEEFLQDEILNGAFITVYKDLEAIVPEEQLNDLRSLRN